MGFTVSFSLPSFQSFAVLRLHCIVYVQTVCFQALFPGGVLASLPELRNGERIPPVASLDSKTTVQWFPVQMILSPRRHWQRLETLLIIMAGGRGLPAGSEQKPCIPWKESSGWNGHHHPTPHYMAEQVLTLLWTLNSGLNEQENHLVLFYSLPGFLWNPAPLVELKESLFQALPATGGGKPQGLACQVPTIQAQSEMLHLLWFTAKSAFCFSVWGWCDTRFIWLKKKMLSSFFFFFQQRTELHGCTLKILWGSQGSHPQNQSFKVCQETKLFFVTVISPSESLSHFASPFPISSESAPCWQRIPD